MIFRVETPDGDIWEYKNLEDARRAVYVFGGTITTIKENEDVREEG